MSVALALAVAVGLMLLAAGPRLAHSRAASLVLGGATVLAIERLLRDEPPLLRMLSLIAATLVAMKLLVVSTTGVPLTSQQWLAFNAWPGMRPAIFTRRRELAPRRIVDGVRAIAAGAALLVLARIVGASDGIAIDVRRVIATIIALPALSLILHFGVFELLAAMWRRRGVSCEPLFRSPLTATSLSDFWSRRWNLGYSEMIAVCVARPAKARAGETAATLVSFLASGVLHELAISVPVRAGFGLPTLYFLLHGVLVVVEKRGLPTSRTWALFWLIAPLPLLFHLPFLKGVVWPLVGLR